MNDNICEALTDLHVQVDLLEWDDHFPVRGRELESAVVLDLWALHVCALALVYREVERLVDKLNLLL